MPNPFSQFFIFKPSCDTLNLKEEKKQSRNSFANIIQVVRERCINLFLFVWLLTQDNINAIKKGDLSLNLNSILNSLNAGGIL